jgi:hypothetical protein
VTDERDPHYSERTASQPVLRSGELLFAFTRGADAETVADNVPLICPMCQGKWWVCEQHPDLPWPHLARRRTGRAMPVVQHQGATANAARIRVAP